MLVVDNIFTPDECKALIATANTLPWHHPKTGGNYVRALLIDRALAERLWVKIKPVCPPVNHVNGVQYDCININDHFRFSRYEAGGAFPIHLDGNNVDEFQNRSMFTLNIFLNDDMEGGGTTFYNNDLTHRLTVAPKCGTGALFYAKQYHRGDVVAQGVKYLLRTDVMVC